MQLAAAGSFRLLLFLSFGVILSGCTPDGPKTYPVSGTVTWEGAPLPDGHIVFASAGNDQTPAAGQIVNGQYTLQAQAGPKLVQIQANREKRGAAVDPAMGAAAPEQYIPAHYNTKTKLNADVQADGQNRFDFQLTEKP